MTKRAPQDTSIKPSIKPAITELEKIYQLFLPLFNDVLSLPVITIQSKGRKSMLGWMAPGRWQNEGMVRKAINEINICAEHLAHDMESIAETILHEMVHHANHLRGISDCSKSQYHNRHFRGLCLEVGLSCERMGRYGWAKTDLSDEHRETIRQANIDKCAFDLFRINEGAEKEDKSKTRMKKWTCGCTIIRAAGDIDVSCNTCGDEFEKEEE